MRVLWITNTIFPSLSRVLGIPSPTRGGWLFSLAEQLLLSNTITLAVATVYKGEKIKSLEIEGILFYLLPVRSNSTYKKKLEPYWQKICSEFNPDLIHIHGTEFTHGLACMRSCPDENYILSIQGLISVISRYYYGGISHWEIFKHITFRDIVKRDSLFQAKRKLERRSILEKEYFMRSHHVIGRTTWDYVHSKLINPLITYHHCNESLRESFYNSTCWEINKITPYTIFLSQGYYPLKGMHQVLKAIAILKADYPTIKLRIGGPKLIIRNNIARQLKINGYGSYINSFLNSKNLYRQIEFIGLLDERQMINEYKNSHIFICPSSIENSPNSLGEAQLLGVPCIGAFCGGIPDMINHGVSGLLYRFEEIEMLASNIRQIFENDNLAKKLSFGGKVAALERHDRMKNTQKMISIYKSVSCQAAIS